MALRLRGRSLVGPFVTYDALELGDGRDGERVCIVAEVAPPGAAPRFPGQTGALARHWVLRGPDAPSQARALLTAHRVESAWLAATPAPPPSDDIPPETPIFEQAWREAFPAGLGLTAAATLPGGGGENVTIVDIEYAWDPTHEDLLQSAGDLGGVPDPQWAFHGTGVVGILAAGDNGFGVTGAAPLATVLVQAPFFDVDGGYDYDVARAIVEAAAVLSAGDVILIEQQFYGLDGEFVPASFDAGVREAIRAATAAGIVVVEPAGNDDVNLDDPAYEGAFTDDTGVLRVGGGASSFAEVPRARVGSNYGALVWVQGWAGDIVTTAGPPYTDLFYPEQDPRQAYTAEFSGTSGASAMIAGLVGVIESVAIATRGAPLTPPEVRAVLVQSGVAAPDGEVSVGALPDLRRVLRTWLVP